MIYLSHSSYETVKMLKSCTCMGKDVGSEAVGNRKGKDGLNQKQISETNLLSM